MPQLTDVALDELEVLADDEGLVPSGKLLRILLADLREARRRAPTYVEVYGIAADQTGLWLLDPAGAWMSPEVTTDSESHTRAEEVLELVGAGSVPALHQTSCRTVIHSETGRSYQVNTYVAGVKVNGLVLEEWPDARPITEELLAAYGQARPHAANGAPVTDDGSVLKHLLRHTKWLSDPDHDATAAPVLHALGIPPHLEPFAEDLARQFRQVLPAA